MEFQQISVYLISNPKQWILLCQGASERSPKQSLWELLGQIWEDKSNVFFSRTRERFHVRGPPCSTPARGLGGWWGVLFHHQPVSREERIYKHRNRHLPVPLWDGEAATGGRLVSLRDTFCPPDLTPPFSCLDINSETHQQNRFTAGKAIEERY